MVDFDIPKDLQETLDALDEFIEREIKPLEQENDNGRFFGHRREDARTDGERGGLLDADWEEPLAEARRRSDGADYFRYFPAEYGGRGGSTLGRRRVAGSMFGFMSQQAPKGVATLDG